MKLVWVLVATAGIARADMLPTPRKAKAKPMATSVPTRAVPCLHDAPSLRVEDSGDVAACWSAGCVKLDFATGGATVLASEPPEQVPFTTSASASVPDICLDGQPENKPVCKKAGPKLEEAVFKELKRPRRPNDPIGAGEPEATTDLEMVLLDGLFSRRRDRLVSPVPPRGIAKSAIEGFTIAGKLVVVQWGPDAAQIVDSNGTNRGGVLASGDVRELDAKRFVIVSSRSSIQLIDANSGKLLGTTTASATDDFVSSVRVANALAIARRTGQGFVVERYRFAGDTPQRAESVALPKCAP